MFQFGRHSADQCVEVSAGVSTISESEHGRSDGVRSFDHLSPTSRLNPLRISYPEKRIVFSFDQNDDARSVSMTAESVPTPTPVANTRLNSPPGM